MQRDRDDEQQHRGEPTARAVWRARLLSGVAAQPARYQHVDVRYPRVRTVQDDDAECDADHDRQQPTDLDAGQYQAGERGREHDARRESQGSVEAPLTGPPPRSDQHSAEQVHQRDEQAPHHTLGDRVRARDA